jgi:cytochrome c-type biogenesis protein CcmE
METTQTVIATPKRRRFPGLLLGVLVLAGGFWALVGSSAGEPYFLTVDEAHAASKGLGDRPVRIKGDAVVGSYRQEGKSHIFQIKGANFVLPVRYDDNKLPDTFQMAMTGGREIVAEGRLATDGTLVATEIVAKCPSKYEAGKVPEHLKTASPNG